MVYPNAPRNRLANLIVDNLPNGPQYGPHTDLEGIDQHQRDVRHYYDIRGNTLVPTEETLAQMIDTSYSIEMLGEFMEEINDIGGEMRNLARLAREYSPNEPLVQVPIRYTVGFGRSYNSIMEDVKNHRILMEDLRRMDEIYRRTIIEIYPTIVRTSILIFMHLGDLYSLYHLKVESDTNIKQKIIQASAKAEAEAISRVKAEEDRVNTELMDAKDDIKMIAEIRIRASINAESEAVAKALFQRGIEIALDIARKALSVAQDAVRSATHVASRAAQINASSISMTQIAMEQAISSVVSATKTFNELNLIAIIAKAESNVVNTAYEEIDAKASKAIVAQTAFDKMKETKDTLHCNNNLMSMQ